MVSSIAPGGKAASVPDPATTAVVVVECQRGVIGDVSMLPALARDAADVVPVIARLLDAARAAGVTVAHATFEGSLGARSRGTAPLWRATKASDEWTAGHPGTEVVPELLEEGDLVLPRHHGLSPTWRTELLPVLRNRGIRTLVLTGVSLNVALLLTAAEAEAEGFTVVVPRDAVAGTPREYGEQVLQNTISMLARITTADALVAGWQSPVEVAR
ncbi:cysteine hydrolase family protein [Trujillonella humicola]|uniref:cysteine hydrolase family protein n=1 Tax=Trujillonella humicola TaxID=3383699 RepID=UPI0039066576